MQQLTEDSYYSKPDSKRKIRVIYYDPDATDSSSDDEDNKAYYLKKRFVQEISLPLSSPTIKTIQAEAEVKTLSDRKRVLGKPTRRPPNSKFKGIRQRKWGKWAAEIRHPLKGVRVWIGTYNTAEEAFHAYQLKKVEFDALAASNYSNPGDSETSSFLEMDSSDVAKEVISMEEKFECQGVGEGFDVQMELDSLFINDYGQVFEDFSLFNDLPICGFDGGEEMTGCLPDFGFDLGMEELAWIEEPINNNIACCP